MEVRGMVLRSLSEGERFNRYVEEMTISDIVVAAMRGRLPSKDLHLVQEIISEKFQNGRDHLGYLCSRLSIDLLRTGSPEHRIFRDNYSSLGFLFEHRTPTLDRELRRIVNGEESPQGVYNPESEESVRQENASFIKSYYDIYTAHKSPGHLLGWLFQHPNVIEALYSREKGRPAAIILGRVKNTERMLQKIGEQLLEERRRERKRKRGQKEEEPRKPIVVDDLFSLKVIAFGYDGVGKLIKRVYHDLGRYGFCPDSVQETYKNLEGEEVEQQPGIDDHYQNPQKRDNIIQLKVRPLSEPTTLLEVDFSHYSGALIDHTEHERRYRLRQEHETRRRLRKSQREEREFETSLALGRELFEKVPKEEGPILLPGKNFPASVYQR